MTAEEILNKHIDSSSSEGVVPVVVDAMREFADQEVAEYKEKLKNGLHSKTEWNYFELLDLIDETHP
jgi:hypothetical protein